MNEQDTFRPLEEGNLVNMPRGLSYIDPQGNRVNVVFGTEFGFPATRYSIKDENGRLIREGGSFAVNFGHALSAGLEQEEGSRAIRVLKETQQVILGSLATTDSPGDGYGGRV